MTREHFLPSLLDRLTDDDPGAEARAEARTRRQNAGDGSAPADDARRVDAPVRRESDERRLYSQRQLRDSVLRDLTWLLNTGNFETVEDLSPYPFVARSATNYGIPDLTGWTASSISSATLEMAVLQAIKRFEPRILADTLNVRAIIATDQMSKNTLGFEIQGLLWGTPVPSTMLVRTEVDLETGHVDIKEFSA